MKIFVLTILLLSTPKLIFPQSRASDYLLHPSISQDSSGNTSITAISPRPLEQAAAGLRRSTGWVIDYEDPKYNNSDVKQDAGGKMQLTGGRFTTVLSKLQTKTPGESMAQLGNLVAAYNRNRSDHKFKVVQTGVSRFDIIPDDAGQQAILDTPIQVEAGTRSLDATIDAILSALSNKLGIKIVQAGIMDGDLIRTIMTSVAKPPVPARQLLAEVLANAHSPKYWIFADETSDGTHYLGIQTVAKATVATAN